jgi:hypothetical protein
MAKEPLVNGLAPLTEMFSSIGEFARQMSRIFAGPVCGTAPRIQVQPYWFVSGEIKWVW